MKQLAKVQRTPSEEPIRSQPNRSQYKATVEDVTDDIIESSNSENDECPRLEEEIDVATLPVARSTTVPIRKWQEKSDYYGRSSCANILVVCKREKALRHSI